MILVLTIITVLIDQFSKKWAVINLKGRGPIKLIDDFFNLYYIENRGAAFGILQERRTLFIVLTTIVILSMIVFIIKYYSKFNLFTKIAIGLLLGGAIGNFIDRVKLGYVIDFLSFRFIDKYSFPVFNFADVFIVISTFMIMLLVIFEDSGNRW